jgi:translocator protein
MEKSNILKLVVSIVLTLGIGSLGAIFTTSEIPTWYAGLQKPSFNPPKYLFGPVWSLLYLLMGISFYLIWKQPASSIKSIAITLFIIQFVLNFCWSIIFFKYHQIGWALVEIITMWVFILLTIIWFAKLHKSAAWLLVPYISWVSFATLLNFALWRLNS